MKKNNLKISVNLLMLLFIAMNFNSFAQPLTANAGTNTSVCLGSAITIGGSPSASYGTPPYTYSWSPATGLSSATAANPTASPSVTTTYTLLVTDAVSGTASATIIVNVNPLPDVTSTPSAQTICSGNNTSISLSGSVGGTSFSWTASQSGVTGASAGSGSVIMQTLTATGTVSGTATYTITPTANGCTGTTTTATVTVNPQPAITSSGTATICSGGTVNLPFTSNITSTYTWSATDNANTTGESTTTQTSGTLNNTINSTAPTTTNVSYTVQPTSLAGCPGNFYPVTVTVNPLPAITATPTSQTICSGNTANVSFSSNIAGTSYSYTVSQSGVTGATSGVAGISQTISTISTFAGSATYTITGTSSGCSGTPITSVVNVNPTPTVTVNSPTICAGNSATLTASANIGGGTYSWSPGGFTGPSITVAPGTTTTYTCSYTLNGCTGNGFGTVTVNPLPSVTVNSTTICNGSSGTLTATASPAGGSYFWTPGSMTTASVTVSPTSTTMYTCSYTLSGCSNSANGTVTVNPLPSATAANSSPVCSGSNVSLSASTVAGATYSWSGPSGFTSTVQNPVITNVSAANAGVYTLYVTAGGCTNTATTTVIINALPSVNAGPDLSGCAGSQINFSASSSGTSFAWVLGNGNNSSLLNPSTTYISAGTYTATLNATSSQGCSASDNVVVTITSNPFVSTSVSNVSCNSACDGSATAIASGSTAPYAYYWSNGNTTQSVTGVCAGTYDVTVIDPNGCYGYDTIIISEPTILNVITSSADVTCNGACNGAASVSVTGGTPSYTFSWVPLGNTTPSVSSLCAGTYTVTVTDANGCNSVLSVSITEPSLFSATVSSPQTICAGDTATLNGTVTGGLPPYTFNWSDGASNYTGMTISQSPLSNTTYTFTATDNSGCTAIANTGIFIVPLSDLYGHVTYSGGNLNTGINTAVAFQYSPFLSTFDTIQVSPVDAGGNYHFSALPNDTYLIKIFNDTAVHPLLIPTYYGNEYMWDSALVLNHGCGMNDTADIQMIEVPAMSGPGMISGTITEGLGFARVPGEPIPGIDIKLGRNPGGQLVASTQSGSGTSAGQYEFTNVPVNLAGETYTIYVDIPGLGRVSTYNFLLDANNTQFPGMDYEADSTSIYITQTSVGIKPQEGTSSAMHVYPNPARDFATVEYELGSSANVSIMIVNILGVKVMETEPATQNAGLHSIKLDTSSDLSNGVYFVTLQVNGNLSTQRLVITK